MTVYMDCIECGTISKYKCPTCRQPYCSVSCCKKHKLNPCLAPVQADNTPTTESTLHKCDFPTEDTVPLEKLQLLENSEDLRKCLENPHVRAILEELDKSNHPDQLIQEYMLEPIFTEFVDECLKVVQTQEVNK